MTTILGIDVSSADLARMASLLAPTEQPFWGSRELLAETGARITTSALTRDAAATYAMYGEAAREPHVVLDEEHFDALPKSLCSRLVRAQVLSGRDAVPTVRRWEPLLGERVRLQADRHRFVWWPSLLEGRAGDILPGVIEADNGRASRHREVTSEQWQRAGWSLPEARALAGTFAEASGPNCFATVMAAAGVPGVRDEWVQRETFEDFLAERTRRGGKDADPGTVLLWRSADGQVQHAAMTLGGGWALNKRGQGWQSPRVVLTAAEVVQQSRRAGWRLTRRRLR